MLIAWLIAGAACHSSTRPSLAAEVERLFKAVSEHASVIRGCYDGVGEKTTISDLCLKENMAGEDMRIDASYMVNEQGEGGGECTPYPQCAKAPEPERRADHLSLWFRKTPEGLLLEVPKVVPGVKLRTPLAEEHNGDCAGKKPPFVPHPIPATKA